MPYCTLICACVWVWSFNMHSLLSLINYINTASMFHSSEFILEIQNQFDATGLSEDRNSKIDLETALIGTTVKSLICKPLKSARLIPVS